MIIMAELHWQAPCRQEYRVVYKRRGLLEKLRVLVCLHERLGLEGLKEKGGFWIETHKVL